MEETDFDRTKHLLDSLNSLSWFAMDVFWMLQVKQLAFVLILPTFVSGLLLCFMETKRPLTIINIAVLSWIAMNGSWMLSETLNDPRFLLLAKSFLGVGLILIVVAIALSKNLSETFSHFKRFRLKRVL